MLRLGGWALSLVAIAYVLVQLWPYLGQLATLFDDGRRRAVIASSALFYAALLLLPALGWVLLLRGCAGVAVPLRTGIAIHCRAQLLKYLPSNALHLIGRHTMARRLGAGHAALVWSAVAETALIALSAMTLALTLGFRLFEGTRLSSWSSDLWPAGALLSLALLLAVTTLLLRFRPNAGLTVRWPQGLAAIAGAALAYVAFFLANGGVLVLLTRVAVPGAEMDPTLLLGLVSGAWVLGFITPGAPAGIGVREAVLLSGLEVLGAGTMAAPLAMTYRVVTTGGDLLCGTLALLLAARRERRREG
ncbi:MAG: hypothetical protein U1E14_06960 [Geminicoccaceae bacterium]